MRIRAPVSVPDIREVTCAARRTRSEYAGAVFLEGPIKRASGGRLALRTIEVRFRIYFLLERETKKDANLFRCRLFSLEMLFRSSSSDFMYPSKCPDVLLRRRPYFNCYSGLFLIINERVVQIET